MKRTILLMILFVFCLTVYCQDFSFRNMSNNDIVIINYSVAYGEMGNVHEGIILEKGNEHIKAIHVVYNFGVTLLAVVGASRCWSSQASGLCRSSWPTNQQTRITWEPKDL